MARGACSAAEYQRMTAEKIAAMRTATGALMRGKGPAAALVPFVSRARSNAKRLRRKT
jgi:predicted GNAT family acetyltransferase